MAAFQYPPAWPDQFGIDNAAIAAFDRDRKRGLGSLVELRYERLLASNSGSEKRPLMGYHLVLDRISKSIQTTTDNSAPKECIELAYRLSKPLYF
jgi:hypothetical protein